jgi:hypothetical protein
MKKMQKVIGSRQCCLGDVEELKAQLTARFGPCYTDDTYVILLDGDLMQPTHAIITGIVPGTLRVTPVDGSKPFEIQVKGSGPVYRRK